MAGRKRGTVRVRGKSISVVLDLGEHPWRKCPTPRCDGSKFVDSTTELACEQCGAQLDKPVLQRRRSWHSGYKTKGEANTALVAMLGQLDQGTFAAPSSTSVRDFVESTWLPGLDASDLRASTVDMYRRSVKRYVLPHLGSMRLRDVTPARLRMWIDGLKIAGLGDRTVEVAAVTCHKLLKAAMDLEMLPRNPADNRAVREAIPRGKAKVPTVWTAEQTRAFLAAQREDRLFALWRLAAMTGLRRGELAGLRWENVKIEEAALRIAATRVVVGYKVLDSEPKTEKGKRPVGLDAATVTALRQHRARQAEERLRAGEAWQDSGLVFVDELGVPYHPDRLTRMLAAKAKAAGLPTVKLHALRHGHATHALEAGVPMKVVQERLGHASIAITSDIYSHVSAAADQAAAAQVAAAVDG
ncbi:MAG: integrase family protein [Acidimicrobiaceae bacterium]|nr:integrase family protein [Acidimicrobiaceae bacterium]